MSRQRKSNATAAASPDTTAQAVTNNRRRSIPTASSISVPRATKEINAAPMLENAKPGIDPHGGMTVSRAIAMAGIMINSALLMLVSWGLTLGLIFGGCCSNVFALEAIVKEEPDSGLLITFVQFLTVSLLTWPGQFSASNPPYYLRKPAIPVIQWIPNIVLFFAVNILNNYAFGFNISVPVHIILRSGGSVTTLIVGWAWGRKYTRMQVLSVAMLTIGVIMAAISDSASKGKLTSSGTPTSMSKFLIGLTILFIAQVLSAIMGLYVQSTYAKYGGHWQENLFYSHFLSLPLFLPFASSLRHEFSRLLASRPLALNFTPWSGLIPPDTGSWLANLTSSSSSIRAPKPAVAIEVPTHMVTLALNAFTQFACIRGVNLLAARTTALGVSILLNMRKLISLFLSICLFGNHLPFGVLVGAVVVFLGGGVYAWDGGRSSSRDRRGKDGEKRRG